MPVSVRENVVFVSEMAANCTEIIARRGQVEAVLARLSDFPGDALMLSPERWLLLAPASAPDGAPERIAAELNDIAMVVDQSSGHVAFRLSGAKARDTLAKGCRLDLHPKVFPLGASARTLIAQVPVIVHLKEAAPVIQILAPRSLACSLAHHLVASATEFGVDAALSWKDIH
jgi:heterotetrameric sarcosine oxidase gamma subunit